ncbi:transposase [Parapusillimonas granuli]|uniref:Transposase n=1 Tax=Parapusillimonas granuli TaxID=380911 RepID=A0A853G005_9BURK|nr:transposase [Parapusillimonas granuli]
MLDDGRIEADNNVAERALRAISVGRKNFLFQDDSSTALCWTTPQPYTAGLSRA